MAHERHCGGAIFGLNSKSVVLEPLLPKNTVNYSVLYDVLLRHPFRRFRSEIKFDMNTKLPSLLKELPLPNRLFLVSITNKNAGSRGMFEPSRCKKLLNINHFTNKMLRVPYVNFPHLPVA